MEQGSSDFIWDQVITYLILYLFLWFNVSCLKRISENKIWIKLMYCAVFPWAICLFLPFSIDLLGGINGIPIAISIVIANVIVVFFNKRSWERKERNTNFIRFIGSNKYKILKAIEHQMSPEELKSVQDRSHDEKSNTTHYSELLAIYRILRDFEENEYLPDFSDHKKSYLERLNS